ncbi:MAG: hypothetical protein OXC02_09965 [Rhodobacteraceae bacterium]|nr:hypothetical protein [Paracoccaceae bacterium]
METAKKSYQIPGLALKFTGPLVHLFRRTKVGIWFHIDTVHVEEPYLEVKAKKLRMNSIQLGAPNLDVLLVIPHEEVEFKTMSSRIKNNFIHNAKVKSIVRQRTKDSGETYAIDWVSEANLVMIALVKKSIVEEAIKFAIRNDFSPKEAIAVPRDINQGWISYFWNTTSQWGPKKAYQRHQFDLKKLHMPVTKIPRPSVLA